MFGSLIPASSTGLEINLFFSINDCPEAKPLSVL
jgi:hypothetical protein